MDSGPHSPVLLQRPAPLHILNAHGSLQSPPFSPELLADTAAITQPQHPTFPEEQPTPPPMEEPPPGPTSGGDDGTGRMPAQDTTTDDAQALGLESGSPQREPQVVVEDDSVVASGDSQDIPEIMTEARVQAPTDLSLQESIPNVEIDSEHPIVNPDPPQPQDVEEVEAELPEWVKYEEETSEITEEELKKIEGTDQDVSALNVPFHEKKIYSDVDDPEQRPVKKLRLSWTIKGVRGTKEQPNYARVMNSPPAYVDGFYWYIKFFPRGNNASNLSSYIKCTPNPPKPDKNVPENTFKVFQGPPEANLGEVDPVVDLSIPATASRQEESKVSGVPEKGEEDSKKFPGDIHAGDNTASADDSGKTDVKAANIDSQTDWRISAQLGTIIYNPAEPRTAWYMSSEHQFNKHNDDWGWTNFTGSTHTDVHIRQRNKRKPLLQNDTLTIDAYIQIYEDPTQALWWHPSPESEKQWDTKSLTGYHAFGTPPLYHSPGVAGLSALLLLKPFRKVLQGIDTGKWRYNTRIKPQVLISQLQIVLFLMRKMKKSELYVNLHPILETLDSYSETFSTVRQFWEILRRSIELELESDTDALGKLADMFDGADVPGVSSVTLAQPVKIPVESVADVQAGIEESLASQASQSFPKFLTIDLDRQKFDTITREWKVLHNRVKLNEEIDLSKFSAATVPSNYTLYGFSLHVGERASGKSYSVLRPNGPGTKWLAFEDGEGNKVFSYTKKRIQDFEGLEGEELSSFRSTRQTASIAMYIRTDCLADFLPGTLEPYDEPSFDWIRSHHDNLIGSPFDGEVKAKRTDVNIEAKKDISVEVYDAARVKGRRGLLDMYNLKDQSQPIQEFTLPATTTYKELRRMIANTMWIENVETIRFWALGYGNLGEYNIATLIRPRLEYAIAGRKYKEYKPICLWVEILEAEDDIRLYGIADPPEPEKPNVDQTGLFGESSTVQTESGNQAADGGDGALNLLFMENQEGLSEGGTPAGTISTPSSGETDHEPTATAATAAAPDQVQDSIAESVSATMASIPNFSAHDQTYTLELSQEPSSDVLRDFDFDSFLNSQPGLFDASGPAGDLTPRAAPVEHGHLVDAVPVEHQQELNEPVSIGEHDSHSVLALDEDNAAVIAAIVAAEVEAADISYDTAHPTTGDPSSVIAETQAEATEEINVIPGGSQSHLTDASEVQLTVPEPNEPSKPQPRAVPHIYGFIQLFDVEQQDFIIHSSFFAPYTSDIKTTIRKAMGYDDSHEICVWQRERSCNTTSVGNGTTFENIRFRDGVDVIVGEPLSEKVKDRLLAEGKFVTPDSLSRYLWMKQRRHPVEAFTGTKTLNTFGRDHYSGPLLNGRFHGENGTYITSTGHVYLGTFVSGVRQGDKAVLTYQNGDVYTGSFHANERHGQGTFIQKRTGNKYVGGYQNDKRWGKGTMYYEVADEEGDMCQICYGEEMDALFYDCGHVCACVDCARQVDVCPICRKSVREVVRVYRA